MRRALLILPFLALHVLADDAQDLKDRLKKLEIEEATRRLPLAEHCEKAKMWKEADAEYKRLIELAPDNAEIQDKAAKSAQKAEVSQARPTKADEDAWKVGEAALTRDLGKKYWELALWASSKGLRLEAERIAEVAEKMDEASGTQSPSSKKFWDTLYPAGDERRQAVEKLNEYRKKCGLPPCVFSARISAGAQRHSEYLVTNRDHPTTNGLGAHDEHKELPGYTPEGAHAGGASDIGQVSPLPSMINMLGTFYHRIPLLSPDLKKVGIGWAEVPDGNGMGWCVIDCNSGVERGKSEGAPRVVAYAPDKMTDVQRAFDNELPDPIPAGEDHDCGEAITLTWFEKGKPSASTMEVKVNGAAVEGYFSTPQDPARKDHGNGTSLCFIPKDFFPANAKIEVSVKATVEGKPFSRTWSFTTGAHEHDAWKGRDNK